MKRLIIVGLILVAAAAVAILALSTATLDESGAIGFRASLNATTVSQNETIGVNAYDWNTLPVQNSPSPSNSLRVQNLSSGPCGDAYPVGIAVYQGNYGLANFSTGSAIVWFAPGPYNCPAMPVQQALKFQPLQNITRYVEFKGYWTAGETAHPGGGVSQGVLHPFLPGQYTIIAGDDWGHTTVLHFQVRGIGLGTFSLCASNCIYPSPHLTGLIYIGGPSPMRSLQLIVNGTAVGSQSYKGNLTNYALVYKGGFQNPPVVKGQTCTIQFVATFEDGSTAMATTTVTAE